MSSTARSLAAPVVPQATARSRTACVAFTPASRTSYSRCPSGWIHSLSGRGSGCAGSGVPSMLSPRGPPHPATQRSTAGRSSGMWNSRGTLQPVAGRLPGGACSVACTSPSVRVSWTATGRGSIPDCAQSGIVASVAEAACTADGDVSTRSSDSSRLQGIRGRRKRKTQVHMGQAPGCQCSVRVSW